MDKAAVLAELAKLPSDEPPAPEVKTEEPPKPDETPAVVETKPEDKAESEPEAPKPPVESVEEEPKPDPARSKWLEQKHREEKRLAQERREWASRVEKTERFEKEIEPSLKAAPLRTLAKHGYLDLNDKEQVAKLGREITAHYNRLTGKGSEADVRAVEVEDRASAAERRAAEAEARVIRFETEQKIAAHLSKSVASVDDTTPAVKALLANDPEEGMSLLREVGDYLTDRDGEIPTPRSIVEALETIERAKLKKRGVDAEKFYAQPPKQATPVADKKATAMSKTLPGTLGTPTTPKKAPMTKDEEKDWVLAQLKASSG